jgi:hypothetical protein
MLRVNDPIKCVSGFTLQSKRAGSHFYSPSQSSRLKSRVEFADLIYLTKPFLIASLFTAAFIGISGLLINLFSFLVKPVAQEALDFATEATGKK